MEGLAAAFFEGRAGDPAVRAELAAVLGELVPAPLVPRYRALTPDFWAWLEAS
jgi:hypothetical protein